MKCRMLLVQYSMSLGIIDDAEERKRKEIIRKFRMTESREETPYDVLIKPGKSVKVQFFSNIRQHLFFKKISVCEYEFTNLRIYE